MELLWTLTKTIKLIEKTPDKFKVKVFERKKEKQKYLTTN